MSRGAARPAHGELNGVLLPVVAGRMVPAAMANPFRESNRRVADEEELRQLVA